MGKINSAVDKLFVAELPFSYHPTVDSLLKLFFRASHMNINFNLKFQVPIKHVRICCGTRAHGCPRFLPTSYFAKTALHTNLENASSLSGLAQMHNESVVYD
jgi:hypothetical protein